MWAVGGNTGGAETDSAARRAQLPNIGGPGVTLGGGNGSLVRAG